MITLTNHIPYELDPSRASLKLKPEDKNSLFGHYLQTIRYTDEAFGDLIRLLKENGMYDNTMIVIYGDHQGMNLETRAVRYKMSKFLGKEYNYEEMLNIPLLFHIPPLSKKTASPNSSLASVTFFTEAQAVSGERPSLSSLPVLET